MFQINTGSAAGPFRMMDQVGLDVVLDIEEHYCAEHPEYPEGPRRLLRTYMEQGRLGVKSGAGFYDDYPQPDPVTDRFLTLWRAAVTNHALLSAAPISAQGTSDAVNQTPLWLQEIQAISAVATTIGVLIALYVAAIREPRKAAAESRRHEAQMDALRRAHRERVTAQARKVIPSCVRTPMFGGSWWTVEYR